METLFDRLSFAPLHDQAVRTLLGAALVQFYAFTLVMVRLSGTDDRRAPVSDNRWFPPTSA